MAQRNGAPMSEAKANLDAAAQARRDHLKLWNSVRTPDQKFVKQLPHGPKLSTVDAQYTLHRATEVFGPIGIGWGVENEEFHIIPFGEPPQTIVYKLTVWYMLDGSRGSATAIADWPYKVKDDVFKKARTAALSKAFSQIGFNADVYLGNFDGQGQFNSLNETKQFGKVQGQVEGCKTIKELDALESRFHMGLQDGNLSQLVYDAAMEAAGERRTELGAATAKRQKAG